MIFGCIYIHPPEVFQLIIVSFRHCIYRFAVNSIRWCISKTCTNLTFSSHFAICKYCFRMCHKSIMINLIKSLLVIKFSRRMLCCQPTKRSKYILFV